MVISLSGCSSNFSDQASSALDECGIASQGIENTPGPVSAAKNAKDSVAALTGDGWLAMDASTSWDTSGLSSIQVNCILSSIGLSNNIVSLIQQEAESQKVGYAQTQKSSSYYEELEFKLEKQLSEAKAAPEWNARLAAYSAKLKAWACTQDDECQQYWKYTVAGDDMCQNTEFCYWDHYLGNFPMSPKPAGKKLEASLDKKIASAVASKEFTLKHERDSLDLFKPIGEKDLEVAFVFDVNKKLLMVMRSSN